MCSPSLREAANGRTAGREEKGGKNGSESALANTLLVPALPFLLSYSRAKRHWPIRKQETEN